MLSIVLAILAVCVGLWLKWRRDHFDYFRKLGIPGPEPNLFFGNVLEIKAKGPVVAQNEWLKKYGRIVGYFNGHQPMLLIADPDLLKKIQIKDFSDFVDRGSLFSKNEPKPPENRQLINLKGKKWKEVRSVLTPSFTTSKLKVMAAQMTLAIDSLINEIEIHAKARREFNIYKHYQALTLEVICNTSFGVSKDLQKNLNDPLLRSLDAFFGAAISMVYVILVSFPELGVFLFYLIRNAFFTFRNRGKNPLTELADESEKIIELRKSDPSKRAHDLLQLMLDSQHKNVDLKDVTSEQLTAGDEADAYHDQNAEEKVVHQNGSTVSKPVLEDVDIKMNTFVVLLAGYETTSNALGSITHLLVNYPDVQEKVRKEIQDVLASEGSLDYSSVHKMKYLDAVTNECLRMYPPIYSFVTRQALVDKQYGDIKIPKGLLIQVPVKSLHYDPEFWANPEEFNPGRFLPENKINVNPMAFQPFGAGPRNCIGMRFAQMEMKIALVKILQRFRFEPSENTEIDPAELQYTPVISRIKNGVYVRAVPVNQQS